MPSSPRILILDDDPIVAQTLGEFLTRDGYRTSVANDAPEAIEVLQASNTNTATGADPIALVVSDINLPRSSGLDLLKRIRKDFPQVVVIMITGFGRIEQAIEAIKLGASDYLTKPLVDNELRIAVSKALRQHALLAENQSLKAQLHERHGLNNLVGSDHRMQRVYDLVQAVAPTKTTVLIDGESGTGKTMIARAVHDLSPRQAGPFAVFACGSIPETLLESELFGHVKGAFTGAESDKPGKILAADGGTLFIDEINSATPALQLKLLRVLQERMFEPVGSSKTLTVDVRFILATNQSLTEMVTKGMFREDLYYRINVVSIQLPPLRQRAGDIPQLAEHFLRRYCREMGKTVTGFTEEAMQAFRGYAWPGNVRELENAIERGVVLTRRPVIDLDGLPEAIVRSAANHASPAGAIASTSPTPLNGHAPAGYVAVPALTQGWTPTPLEVAMQEPEKQIILAALRANHWNRQTTAQQLDINRTTLYKKMKQFGMDDPV